MPGDASWVEWENGERKTYGSLEGVIERGSSPRADHGKEDGSGGGDRLRDNDDYDDMSSLWIRWMVRLSYLVYLTGENIPPRIYLRVSSIGGSCSSRLGVRGSGLGVGGLK